MDMKQEEITTLHDLNLDKAKLVQAIGELADYRPVSVVMPMLYSEIKSDALKNITNELNKCTYLHQIIIPLAANNEEEFMQVKRFFKQLKIPNLIMWCNGPNIENLLNSLRSEGLNLNKYRGKGQMYGSLSALQPYRIMPLLYMMLTYNLIQKSYRQNYYILFSSQNLISNSIKVIMPGSTSNAPLCMGAYSVFSFNLFFAPLSISLELNLNLFVSSARFDIQYQASLLSLATYPLIWMSLEAGELNLALWQKCIEMLHENESVRPT